MLEHKQGLIAGDGTLPVKMAQYAKENGFEVICISLSKDNLAQLKKYCTAQRYIPVTREKSIRLKGY